MDRRFLTWLMLTSAMFFLYMSMRPQENQLAEDNKPVAQPNADPLLQTPQDGGIAAEVGVGEEINEENPPADFPMQVVTLGSMDIAEKFNLLVTISSKGAGVERVELVEQTKPGKFRYRALEHEGAYLGYLAPRETLEGIQVLSVPPGSPAALATSPNAATGLQVGDVISKVNGISVRTAAELESILARSKAKSTAELTVQREDSGTSQELIYKATTVEPPLDMVRMSPWNSEVVPGNKSLPALQSTISALNGTRVPEAAYTLPALAPTLEANWKVEPLEVPGGQGVELSLPLNKYLASTGRPSKLEIVRRFRLLPASEASSGYTLDLETLVRNDNDEAVDIGLRQEGVPGLTLEGWWYSVKISPHMFSGAGNRDVIYNSRIGSHQISTTRQIQDHARKKPQTPNIMLFSEGEPIETRSLSYIGVDAQYFNASLSAHPDDPEALTDLRQGGTRAVADAAAINKSQAQATNTSFWIDTLEETVQPGAAISQRFEVFLGPKDSELLATQGLDRAIEYGWFPWIAKPLGWILHFFYAIVHNYGLAIVMLTVLVRGCMFPLGRKAAMNAQRMQELQPELKRINDLYKDNMEKRAKAMQELYAKHNFKPLAGCLPMFIQLPIFIGLYRCLSVDISLRQQPLIPGLDWCSNLAGPDQLVNWSSWMPEFLAGRGVGWLGPYFNILPMVTVALFILQQKMLMPKATDDQTRMTQNMMQVMTIFMGVLFFKVPSGLCIYFITSSLWSLVERKLVKRLTPPPKPIAESSTTPSKTAKPSDRNKRRNESTEEKKQPGKIQELMKLLEKPAVKSATQRGPEKPTAKQNGPQSRPNRGKKGKGRR